MPDGGLGEMFDRLRAQQWTVRQRTAKDRRDVLVALKHAIVSRREAVLDAMHTDFRKNRGEAELSELQLVLTELNEAIARVGEWMRPLPVGTPMHMFGTRSEIRFEPRGVVLIMAAWNYPFALLFAPLVGAVAAGNCVVIRPSERVPHTNAVARAIVASVFSDHEVAFVEGDTTTAAAVLELPFDHVFFTGTTEVGRRIMTAASTHLASVTLELGGKSPAIVDQSADIGAAAERIMWGKFVNAGQTCVAPDYVLVHSSVQAAFLEASRRTLAAFYGASDDARHASGDYCRIIDRANWTRLTSLLASTVAAGARIEAGGQSDGADLYIAPTLLSNVDPRSPIMTDEIFGPVLPVLTYETTDEIIRFLRERPKPLALYIFGRDERRIEQLLQQTTAGGTVVNNCLIHLLNPNLPFGGVGASGFGRYHGRFGFETFSNQRAVVVQGRLNAARFIYPPYQRLRSGLLGRVLALGRRLRD